MALRIETTIVGGIGEDGVLPAAAHALDSLPNRGDDAERLIGDRPSRWISLAGMWLAMAFSVAFGLYVNLEAQGIEGGFLNTLMAMIPHYFFWVLVSPPLYRSLHRTIEGPGRMLWASMLLAWSGIALAGSTAASPDRSVRARRSGRTRIRAG